MSDVSSAPRSKPGLVETTPRTCSPSAPVARSTEMKPLATTISPGTRVCELKYISARSEFPVYVETDEMRPVVEAVQLPSLSTQRPPKPICRPAMLLVVPSPMVVVP